MRILRVCPTPLHTQQLYKKDRPRKFQQAIQLLRDNNILIPGGFKEGLEALGHEVFETSFDDHYLQGLWAFENGALSAFSSHSPSTAVLARQIEHFRPDIVFLNTGAMYRLDNKERQYLRSICTHQFKCVGFWGDEVPHFTTPYEYFGDLDFLFTSNDEYTRYFQENGLQSATWGSAFDEKFASPGTYNPAPDFNAPLFVGDTGYLAPDHIRRYEILDELMRRTNLKIFGFQRRAVLNTHGKVGYVLRTMQTVLPDVCIKAALRLCYRYCPQRQRVIRGLAAIRTANTIGISVLAMLPQSNPLASYFIGKPSLRKKYPGRVGPGPLSYHDYLRLLSSYAFNINIHRDEERDYGNIRCFEATGMGSLLFSDRAEKMEEFFVEGKEFVGFTDAEDLAAKIDYYRRHPEEAKAIAAAGQKRTLEQYTLRRKCQILHKKFLELAQSQSLPSNRILVANYDLSRYPISYDFAFFLECALIKKKISRFKELHVNLILPQDIHHIAGVNAEADKAVDAFGRSFRIHHICAQTASLFPLDSFRILHRAPELSPESESPLYAEYPHHAEFYAFVNENCGLVEGFQASRQARRYAQDFLLSVSKGPYCSISLRHYAFDTQRNSNLTEWQRVVDDLMAKGVTPIILPDTDQFGKDVGLDVPARNIYWPGCFDVDLRYGLYELCDFNFFVNNGPATLASLNRHVKLASFKLVAPGVPHCTVEFIERQGFRHGQSPGYCTPHQRWHWVDDTYANIKPVIDAYFSQAATSRTPKLLQKA